MNQKKKNRRGGSPNANQRTRKKRVSDIDPKQLIKKAEIGTEVKYQPNQSFNEFPIDNQLKSNLKKMGFEYPTEIQEKTFDYLQDGKNVVGIANTGTGKTAAFLIPIIQQLIESPSLQTLILVPTRELALQIKGEFDKLSKNLSFKSSCFIGGTNIASDINQARRPGAIIIGTPGRLLDLNNRRALDLRRVQNLVIDEFDRMLDMGFINDLNLILKTTQNRKHTMLFSATLNTNQEKLISEIVPNAIRVEVSDGVTTSKNINQDIIRLNQGEDKYDLLTNLIMTDDVNKVILFAETKRLADRLSKRLNKSGIKSDQIHGDKSQNYRVKALNKFKSGSIKVLVATDVAARGIDVDDVSHVINYQLPYDYDTYIHRIGRTGRAGKTGTALTFID